MKALIQPNQNIHYIASWTQDPDDPTRYAASYGVIENVGRVAQVEANEFEVASPLFWVDCDASAVTDEWYYDPSDLTVKIIPNVAEPT